MNQLRACYNLTREPIFAWKAFDVATANKLPLPLWLGNHLKIACGNLIYLSETRWTSGRSIAAAVTEAFGFVPGGVMVAYYKRHTDEDLERWVSAWKRSADRKPALASHNPP